MTKQEAITKAIDAIKGAQMNPGQIIAHRSNDRAVEFLQYEDDQAVCHDVIDGEVRYPRSEVFDPNKLINVANHFLNVGFWKEGMESMFLEIK